MISTSQPVKTGPDSLLHLPLPLINSLAESCISADLESGHVCFWFLTPHVSPKKNCFNLKMLSATWVGEIDRIRKDHVARNLLSLPRSASSKAIPLAPNPLIKKNEPEWARMSQNSLNPYWGIATASSLESHQKPWQ